MDNQKSGVFGIGGLIGLAALYLVMRRFFPHLSTLLLVILGIAALVVIAIVVVVMVFAFQKPKEETGKPTSADVSSALSKGRSELMDVRRTAMYIRDSEIKGRSEEICGAANRIMKTLKDQPENIPDVRRFFNYYLPTLNKILDQYRQLQDGGVLTPETRENALTCLNNISSAMDKQYQNLFEDDVLDITAEMKAMNMILKGEGLLEEQELVVQEQSLAWDYEEPDKLEQNSAK